VKKLCLSAFVVAAGCGNPCTNPAKYAPQISPANFPTSTKIDNRFFPLTPGTTLTYRDGDGNVVAVQATSDTKTVMNVPCLVVHDVARSAAGALIEDTLDWYAQDKDGNVWYMGEDTKLYTGGAPSTKGSWQGGVNCAQPGIVMPGNPKVGDRYRQEYLPGEAEDQAEVLSLSESVTVAYGSFQSCLETNDFTALEPGTSEHKYYCAGVGAVSTIDIVTVGTGKKEELTAVTVGP
jgi:hypothetical protein